MSGDFAKEKQQMNNHLTTDLLNQAKIRVVFIPVGQISKEAFRKYSRLLAKYDSVRLIDLVPDVSGGNHRKFFVFLFNEC